MRAYPWRAGTTAADRPPVDQLAVGTPICDGFVSKRLQDDGVKVVLVEPGKIGAMNAHKRGVKTVLCSTLEDAEFDFNSIDSVGIFDVVEHMADDFS